MGIPAILDISESSISGGSPGIEINAAKRILRLKGALSGMICTGTDKVRSGYGNGDCLYCDLKHRVFAVADGTERFPWASRDILARLSRTLEETDRPETAADWRTLINGNVYAGQKYQHKTTFSCVAVSGDDTEVALTVAHGGDSVVMVIDSVSGKGLSQTGRNMVFAGRSREIVDVIEHRITSRNARVLIYSDGFNDFSGFCLRASLYSHLADIFISVPVDDIGERIHSVLWENAHLFEHDDISLIAIDPFHLNGTESKRILMGGTQPHQEKSFRKSPVSGEADRWIPHAEWDAVLEILLRSGITIL